MKIIILVPSLTAVSGVSIFGDKNPGWVLKQYWLVKDGLASAFSFYRQYGFKAYPMYYRYLKDAVRQFIAGMQ